MICITILNKCWNKNIGIFSFSFYRVKTKMYNHSDAILITLNQHLHTNKIFLWVSSTSGQEWEVKLNFSFPFMIYNSLFQDYGRGNKSARPFEKLSFNKEAFSCKWTIGILYYSLQTSIYTQMSLAKCVTHRRLGKIYSLASL